MVLRTFAGVGQPRPTMQLCSTSGVPRIDHRHGQIVEMPDIAGGERRTLCKRNAGDYGIKQIALPSGTFASTDQRGRFFGSRVIKRQDSRFEILLNQPIKRRLSIGLPAPARHNRKTGTNLKHGDCCRPEGCPWLTIKPRERHRIRLRHQLRYDVGIEDNHYLNFGVLSLICNCAIGSSSSMPLNSLAASVPNPLRRLPSSFTASRRMSRISSSMEWPCWAARRCNLRLTASSRLRTIT